MHLSRRQLVAALVAVALLVAGAGVWWATARAPQPAATPSPTPSATPTATPAPSASPSPTAAPAAPDPVAPPVADPADPPAPEPTAAPPGTSLADVEVVTTYAGWNDLTGSVEVGAYAGTVEADGACTLTLTGPGGTRTARSAATPDASSTSCGALGVAGGDLTPGTWEAVVAYESPRSRGSSAAVTVEVP